MRLGPALLRFPVVRQGTARLLSAQPQQYWGRTALKYTLRTLSPITALPSGFQPALGADPTLPFRVHRTNAQQLPVYSDVRKGGSQVTIVRRFEGDWQELSQELSALLGGAEVRHRSGSLEVSGRHVARIKSWLLQLGF